MRGERLLDARMRAEGWLSVAAAARCAVVHVTSIYRMLDDGKLVGKLAGSARYVEARSLQSVFAGVPGVVEAVRNELAHKASSSAPPELGDKEV